MCPLANINNDKKSNKKKIIKKIFSWQGIYYQACIIIVIIFIIIYKYFSHLSTDLPSLDQLNRYNPEQATNIFSSENLLIKQLYMHSSKREIVDISQLPEHLINALIIMEDRDFYIHNGVDIKGVLRAVVIDLITFSTKQGASTITQQLARNMYNDPDAPIYIGAGKNIERKLKELLTAFKIEQVYTKSEILELYFNSVYFGHGNYGIQSASKYYFGKDAKNLTLDESSILIGLLPAPAKYSPISHPNSAISRKKLVLSKMLEYKLIEEYEYEEVINLPLPIKNNEINNSESPYFTEYIRRELERLIKDEQYTDSNNNGKYDYNEKFIDLNNDGEWTEAEFESDIYKDGLTINTTLDYGLQNILEKVFYEQMLINQKTFNNNLLKDKDKLELLSQEFQISIDSLKNILNDDAIIPEPFRKKLLVQGAVIILDSEHGHILSMIGGRTEYSYLDHFNRSTQAERQPGSIFKPFVYLSALENGSTACSQVMNQPLVIYLEDNEQYNPQNWDNSVGGLTSLRNGLKKSLNIVSVRVSRELSSPFRVKKTAEKFNFSTKIRAVESIALGVSEVKLIDITSAYAAIANNGILRKPLGITTIFDNEGRMVKEFNSESKEVADASHIFILRDMMKSVILNGTGSSIRWKYKFFNPAAGKTGTSQEKKDAWFVGFTPQITIGVWVGLDDQSMELGQYGAKAALPIFAQTINQLYDRSYFSYNSGEIILANSPSENKYDWIQPNDILMIDICETECCMKTDWCNSYKEYFQESNLPSSDCDETLINPLMRFE